MVINSTAINFTAYADSGLAKNTTYYYQVRAWNSTGTSEYTNVASSTTLVGIVVERIMPAPYLYPSPAKGTLHLVMDEAVQQSTILLTDVSERIVLSRPLNGGLSSHTLDISTLKAGVYFLRMNGYTASSFVVHP